MRFTKIPLIATLMAVALSLLIVLPGLAQTTVTDITDGKGENGPLTVGVFDDIADAQVNRLVEATTITGANGQAGVYVPNPATPTHLVGTEGQQGGNGTVAFFTNPQVSPQDTFFRNTLYVSNAVDAYNTVLINVTTDPAVTATCMTEVDTTDALEAANANVTATVKNNRSGKTLNLEMVADGTDDFQAFFKVVHRDAVDANRDAIPESPTVGSGPTWCADITPEDTTDDGVDNPTPRETMATSAVDTAADVDDTQTTPLQQEIATIYARHGDRITVTAGGRSVDLVVDGDGPDFSTITPEDNDVAESRDTMFSFEVRDDESGLRHDGESITSPDGDLEHVNADEDQILHEEPLSVRRGGTLSTNGASADIKVNVLENPLNVDTSAPTADDDISASGTWSMAASRPGVAYSFRASGSHLDDASYLYQLTAKDRAGNTTVTDAVPDSSINTADEPYVFRVDDVDPELTVARTGISWDSEDNEETVDRNYIALEFRGDPIDDVNLDSITVVGHTVVGYIRPTAAPAINRGDMLEPAASKTAADDPDDGQAEGTNDPGDATAPNADSIATENQIQRTDIGTTITFDFTFIDSDPPLLEPADGFNELTAAQATVCENPRDADSTATPPVDATDPSKTECDAFTAWSNYEKALSAKRVYDSELAAFRKLTQFDRENPGTDIEGNPIRDPRSFVYLELSEDLASDEKPSVLLVSGAVLDLAGNGNASATLTNVQDWIAPKITVTVTGTAGDRPVANDDGGFTLDVRADEDLRRRPNVFFVSISATKTDATATADAKYSYSVASVEDVGSLTLQQDEAHWAKTYKVDGDLDDFDDGLIGVVLVAQDEDANLSSTAGWSPSTHRRVSGSTEPGPVVGNSLNLEKMDDAGLLAEIDTSLMEAAGSVTPKSDDDGTETESASPFIKLAFGREAMEYPLNADGDNFDSQYEKRYRDSHAQVVITELELNGDNVMDRLNRINASEFSVINRDLAVGDYTVTYTAEDDAGNEFEGEFDFEVKERQPYTIRVKPGWNLVSLPATPLESGISDVLANNQYISPVLGYQQGDWITAVNDDGTWRGRLTEIVGGYGYWVHARTFESIETMLSEVDPAGTLPTVPVTAGWNLLGVLDIFQNDEGDAPGEAGSNGDEADNYFGSIPWRVAYSYDTAASLWEKVTEGVGETGGEIANGRGYWVWSPEPSTLVP